MGDTAGSIPEIDWATYDLPRKLSWVMNGTGGAAAAPTCSSLGDLSTSLSSFDATLQMLSRTASVDWQGAAGEKAAAGLRTSARNSAETSEAHARGSASVTAYGGSYDSMSAALHSRQQPEETWWTDVQDFFGVQTDYKQWVDRRDEIEREVDTALRTYETDARAALTALTPPPPNAPVIAGPGTPDESGTAALRNAALGRGGGTAGAGSPSVGGGGTATTGGGDQQAGGQAGGAGTVSPAPGIGGGQDGSGQNGSASGTPGTGAGTVGGGSGAGRVEDLPAWTSTAGVATPTAPPSTGPYAPGPTSSTPYAPSATGLPGAGDSSAWGGGVGAGGVGGRGVARVSTGAEFAERLPRAAQPAPGESPSAQRQAVAAEARATAARQGTAPGSATPMMGGGGAGGNDRTRQARYVIPSSAPFAVPLPAYPDGLITPDDDDEW